jgi:conjugal transfer pilus assembly protein TraK
VKGKIVSLIIVAITIFALGAYSFVESGESTDKTKTAPSLIPLGTSKGVATPDPNDTTVPTIHLPLKPIQTGNSNGIVEKPQDKEQQPSARQEEDIDKSSSTIISSATSYLSAHRPPENYPKNSMTTVLPEILTPVYMSNKDVNLITCPVDIQDGDEGVVRSKEKGVKVSVKGKYAFVKFLIKKTIDDGKEKIVYTTTPSELFVLCGGSIFKLIAYPDNIPSQSIYLNLGVGNRVKENVALFKGSTYKKKILSIVKDIYKDNIPESFSVTELGQSFDIFKDLNLVLKRVIRVEGEGILVKEYIATLKEDVNELKLHEKFFLNSKITNNTAFITIDNHLLKSKGEKSSRIIIVENTVERGSL